MTRVDSMIGRNRTHGIRATYVDGCRCRPCKRAEAEYSYELRKREGRPARTQRQRPEFREAHWTDEARCKGHRDFFYWCCASSVKERNAYTATLRAICNACPVLGQCREDVMYYESFHPDKDRALFQAGFWPEERVVEARVRRIAAAWKAAG